jgi:hypothetical protein
MQYFANQYLRKPPYPISQENAHDNPHLLNDYIIQIDSNVLKYNAFLSKNFQNGTTLAKD